MSKKSGNKDGSSPILPMFFRLNLCCIDNNYDMIDTGVCIDFNERSITFSNPKTPVSEALMYVKTLPSFFDIKSIIILSDAD